MGTQLDLDDLVSGYETARKELAALRAALESTREAMVMLAALAGSEMNADIPWAKLDANARALLRD